jgi:hypothetical protein
MYHFAAGRQIDGMFELKQVTGGEKKRQEFSAPYSCTGLPLALYIEFVPHVGKINYFISIILPSMLFYILVNIRLASVTEECLFLRTIVSLISLILLFCYLIQLDKIVCLTNFML